MSGVLNRQRGMTISKLLFVCIAVGAVALVAIKLLPEYVEYWKIKADVVAIGEEVNANPDATVGDVRQAFERRADIDEIHAIKSTDLDITKEGDSIVIGFAYERKIHLIRNISVLIEFEGSSAK